MSLQDKIDQSRRAAQEARGKRDYLNPVAGKELHYRICEWLGHEECWIEEFVHYIQGPEGKKRKACGEADCFSCERVAELSASKDKRDQKVGKDTRRVLQVTTIAIDLDNRSLGPQIWQPKDTQACPTWNGLLSIFANPDYGDAVYKFDEGRLLTLLFGSEERVIDGKKTNVMLQKSLLPGTKPLPIPYRQNGAAVQIQLMMPDKTKRTFTMPNLADMILTYDDDEHRALWGEKSPSRSSSSGSGSAPAAAEDGWGDEGEQQQASSAGDDDAWSEGAHQPGGDDDAFGGGGEDSPWGDGNDQQEPEEAPAPSRRPVSRPAARPAARPAPARGGKSQTKGGKRK